MLIAGTVNERKAHPVHHRIGQHRGNQFPPQAMVEQCLAVLFNQHGREVVKHIPVKERIVWHPGSQQGIKQGILGIGQQHRQLGTGQSLAAGAPLDKALVIRQEFHRTGEHALALQHAQMAGVLLKTTCRIVFQQTQRQALNIVISQHRLGHIIGHGFEQGVPLAMGEGSRLEHLVERNLDIYFPVRTVHTAGVINGISINTPTLQSKLHPPQLGQAQVAALTDHLATQFTPIDTDSIIGPVSHLGMTLITALDVGANATVPEQFHRRLENGLYQLGRGQAVVFDPQRLTGLGTEADILGRAGIDFRTFGEAVTVKIVPG